MTARTWPRRSILLFTARKPEHGAVTASSRCLLLGLAGWTLLSPRVGRADDDGGWSYLSERLVADGLDRARVMHTFSDPRMEPFTGLDFGLNPREPPSRYRGFLRASSVAAARRCRTEHASDLDAAAHTTGVPASLVAAILYVETGCGQHTGSSRVFYRLARLAMANEPANLRANIARLAGDVIPDAEIARQVRERAQYLEDTFYPEVRAAFDVADRMGVDLLDLRGSPSGAIGIPQFLPTNYLRYGIDATGGGHVDLFNSADAAASCAAYLADKGWHAGLSERARRAVIWHYNRSPAYVEAVLTLARRLDTNAPLPVQHAAARPRIGHGRNRSTSATAARSTGTAKRSRHPARALGVPPPRATLAGQRELAVGVAAEQPARVHPEHVPRWPRIRDSLLLCEPGPAVGAPG
jgi:membrane-bound lytic murein transglycosylase B